MNTVTQRRYVAHSDAHYAGGLVDGAYVMRIFGEVATEMSIVTDKDEGLLAGYEAVQFLAPIYGGDIVEVTGTAVGGGRRSRRIELSCQVTSRAVQGSLASHAELLEPAILATSAVAVVVVPEPQA